METKEWITNLHTFAVERFRQHTEFKVSVGAPQPTSAYTVDQLRKQGLVGIYKESPESNDNA